MNTYDVVVFGSINLDIVTHVKEYPSYGDSVLAQKIETIPGGKGANQAITVAKQGSQMLFISSVGKDSSGNQMIQNLESYGIQTDKILRSEKSSTRMYVIFVDENGENTMAGSLGANLTIPLDYIEETFSNIDAKVLLLQMETSPQAIIKTMQLAKEKGMFVILDPAPAGAYFPEVLKYADVITPNQQETEMITGIHVDSQESAIKAAKKIQELGVQNSIIKMGDKGNLVYQSGQITYVPALKVRALNTVGAGDTFAGALASEYVKTGDLVKAVEYANIAAGIKVSHNGGQEVIPTESQVRKYMEEMSKELIQQFIE
ncbi:MAG: ribokinase [Longibaculum sp.]